VEISGRSQLLSVVRMPAILGGATYIVMNGQYYLTTGFFFGSSRHSASRDRDWTWKELSYSNSEDLGASTPPSPVKYAVGRRFFFSSKK